MRIGSTLSGIDLATQNNLLRTLGQQDQAARRLATLVRINRGSDDPAGLIAVEQLRSELTALEAASESAARAGAMTAVADSALSQVSDLLVQVRGNVVEAAGGGLSPAEVEAKQMEIDAALAAIDRIGRSTSLGGRELLDGGSLDFNFSPALDAPASVALPKINQDELGGPAGPLSDLTSGGPASLASGNAATAAKIVQSAQGQVLDARARLGAFQRFTVESAREVLGSTEVSLSAATSAILDADVAAETSQMLRTGILASAGMAALAIAGHQRSAVAGLLARA